MKTSRALFALPAIAIAMGVTPASAFAYCPCYSPSSQYNSYNCGVNPANGSNPTPAQWAPIFDLVAQGPSVWGTAGPAVGDIGAGCGMPQPTHNVAAKFPCEILKTIAMVESGWTQFCVPDSPADEVGGASRTIIAFDCGYGVGQVTSGMHTGETPAFDRAKVASDPTYNLATGTQILADKWKATNCVGDNQPTIVEDWYTAVWAYNGLAYVNNPTNPNYSASRGVYNPAVNHACPYQERVFGRVEYPTSNYWPSVGLAYPKPTDCGSSGSPPNIPEPHCASPTDCASSRSVHQTACMPNPTTTTTGATTSATTGGGTTSSKAATGAGATTSTSATSVGAGPGGGGPTGAGGAGGGANPDNKLHGTCGCRVAGDPIGDAYALLGLLGLAVALRARRARV